MHFEKIANSSTGGTRSIGRIAVVAIGNPLIDADRLAIDLMDSMRVQEGCLGDSCLFEFDGNFAWLGAVLKQHESVIILDSLLDTNSSHDNVVTIPITRDVIETSGFSIRASHALSWLDEIKFQALESKLPKTLIFLGLSSRIGDRQVVLKQALEELIKITQSCSVREN